MEGTGACLRSPSPPGLATPSSSPRRSLACLEATATAAQSAAEAAAAAKQRRTCDSEGQSFHTQKKNSSLAQKKALFSRTLLLLLVRAAFSFVAPCAGAIDIRLQWLPSLAFVVRFLLFVWVLVRVGGLGSRHDLVGYLSSLPRPFELELELIQSHMAQKPVPRFSLPRRGHLVTEPASAPSNRTQATNA